MLSTTYGFMQSASPSIPLVNPIPAHSHHKTAQDKKPSPSPSPSSHLFPTLSKGGSCVSSTGKPTSHHSAGHHESTSKQLLKKMSSVSRLRSRPSASNDGSIGTVSTTSTTSSDQQCPIKTAAIAHTPAATNQARPPTPPRRRRSNSSDLWGSPLDAEAVALGLVAPNTPNKLPLTPRTPIAVDIGVASHVTSQHSHQHTANTSPKTPLRRLLRPPSGFRRHHSPQRGPATGERVSRSSCGRSSPTSIGNVYPRLWSQVDHANVLRSSQDDSSGRSLPSQPSPDARQRDRPSSSPSRSSSLLVQGKDHFVERDPSFKLRSQSVPREEQRYEINHRTRANPPPSPVLCPTTIHGTDTFGQQMQFRSPTLFSTAGVYHEASSQSSQPLSHNGMINQFISSPASSRTWLAAQDFSLSSPETVCPENLCERRRRVKAIKGRGGVLPPPSAPPTGPLPPLPAPPQTMPSSGALPHSPWCSPLKGFDTHSVIESTSSPPSSPLRRHGPTTMNHSPRKGARGSSRAQAPSAWVKRDLDARQRVAFATVSTPPVKRGMAGKDLQRTPAPPSMSLKSTKMSTTCSARGPPSSHSSSQLMQRSASSPEFQLSFVETVNDVFFDQNHADEDSEDCQTPTSGSYSTVLPPYHAKRRYSPIKRGLDPASAGFNEHPSPFIPRRTGSLVALSDLYSAHTPSDGDVTNSGTSLYSSPASSPSSSERPRGRRTSLTCSSVESVHSEVGLPTSLPSCSAMLRFMSTGTTTRSVPLAKTKPNIEITLGDGIVLSTIAGEHNSSSPGRPCEGNVGKSESVQRQQQDGGADESAIGRGRAVSHTWDPETEQIVMNYLSLSSRKRSGSSVVGSVP